MNKKPIPSRNRKVIFEDRCSCPSCRATLYYDLLEETGFIKEFSENTKIITCPMCNEDFVPDVSKFLEYKYSGKNKRKDRKDD